MRVDCYQRFDRRDRGKEKEGGVESRERNLSVVRTEIIVNRMSLVTSRVRKETRHLRKERERENGGWKHRLTEYS